MKKEDPDVEFTFGYLLENCNDWDSFCADVGLNPWLLNEGLAESEETYPVKMSILQKHGILTTSTERR